MNGLPEPRSADAPQHWGVVLAIAWSIVSSGHAQEPTATPKPMVHVYDESSAFLGLKFSPDGQRLWNVTLDSWNVRTGLKSSRAEFSPMLEEEEVPFAMDLSQDGSRIVTASSGSRQGDGPGLQERENWPVEIRLWDAAQTSLLSTFNGHSGSCGGVQFLRSDESIGVWYRDPAGFVIYDAKSNWEERESVSIGGTIDFGAFDVRSRLFGISQMRKNRVALWRIQTVTEEQVLAHEGAVPITFDAQGRHVATGGKDNCVRVWDVATGKELQILKGHAEGAVLLPVGIYSLSFDRTGKLLASGGHDGRVVIWDIETGKPHFEAQISTKPIVLSLAFTPDSRQVAAGYMGVKLEAGFCIWQIPAHGKPAEAER